MVPLEQMIYAIDFVEEGGIRLSPLLERVALYDDIVDIATVA
jgi:hypothetical protein